MPIDSVQRIDVSVNDLGSNNSTDQSIDASHDLVRKIIKQVGEKIDEKQTTEKKTTEKVVDQQSRGEAPGGKAAPKFEQAMKSLLSGMAGPTAKSAAETVNTPIFNRAPAGAKEEFAEVTQKNPQAGYEAASGFRRVTSQPGAEAALNSSEAAGMVVQTYTKPTADLGKKEETIKEFIQAFGDTDADPTVNKKALRYGLQNPQTEGQKELYKGLGSDNGKQLATVAKEALINLQGKGNKDDPAPLKNAMSLIKDPTLMKNLGGKDLSKATSLLCKEGASTAQTKDLTAILKNEKFFAMSGKRRDQMLDLVGKNGASQFRGVSDKLNDSLKSLRKDAQQQKALRLLLETKGELTEDEIEAAVSKAKKKQVAFPPFEPIDPDDPDAEKETGAQLAQWMAAKQKMMQFNKKVGQRIDGAKSREELAAIDPLKSFASAIGECKTPEELSKRPGGPPLKVAQFIFQAQADVEASSVETKRKFSLQRRALKRSAEPLTHLKANRASVKKTPNKTTFTLPTDDGTSNSTVSLSRLFAGSVSASVAPISDDESDPSVANGSSAKTFVGGRRSPGSPATTTASPGQARAARTSLAGLAGANSASALNNASQSSTNSSPVKAPPAQARGVVKGWGNNTIVVGGIDRESRAGIQAVKPPSAKTASTATGPVTADGLGDVTTLKKGPSLVRHGVEIRQLSGIIQDGAAWNKLNSSEIAVLRNLGITRTVLESMRTPRPNIPTLFLENFESLKEHQKKSVVLLGIAPDIWNSQATQLRSLRGVKSTPNVNNVTMKGNA